MPPHPALVDRGRMQSTPIKENLMAATISTERRELAHRIADGIEVSLFWRKSTNRITIELVDSLLDESVEFTVDNGNALDAFHHPYSYVREAVAA
jgi:hypothetical protein